MTQVEVMACNGGAAPGAAGGRGVPALEFLTAGGFRLVANGRSGTRLVPARGFLTTGGLRLVANRRSGARLVPARRFRVRPPGRLVSNRRSGTRGLPARRFRAKKSSSGKMPRELRFLSGGDDRIRTGDEGFAGLCLTTWPRRQICTSEKKSRRERAGSSTDDGAEDGARTRDPNLGKVVLYQLSHFRAQGGSVEKAET